MHQRLRDIGLSGIAGSAVMLAVLYTIPLLTFAPGIDILALLGTFFTDGPLASLVGAGLFLAAGLFSAAVYAGLWKIGVGRPSPKIGAIFGIGQGLGSLVILQTIYALHPDPPSTYLTGNKTLAVMLGHIAFGIVVGLVYRHLTAPAEAPEGASRPSD